MDVNLWAIALPSVISTAGAFVGVLLGLGASKKNRAIQEASAARVANQSMVLKLLEMMADERSSVGEYGIELLAALEDSGNLSAEQVVVVRAALRSKIARKISEYDQGDEYIEESPEGE